MPINLPLLLQLSLLLLIIAVIVAVIQLIIILIDVRKITARLHKAISLLRFVEFFLDSEDVKMVTKKVRNVLFGAVGTVIDKARKVVKGDKCGGENNGERL